MPYIPTETERQRLDPLIKQLAAEVYRLSCDQDNIETSPIEQNGEFFEMTGGRMNYILCELMLGTFSFPDQPKYYKLERIMGCLTCVQHEIYRRVGAPYEDTAIERNGDTKMFAKFKRWLEKWTRTR